MAKSVRPTALTRFALRTSGPSLRQSIFLEIENYALRSTLSLGSAHENQNSLSIKGSSDPEAQSLQTASCDRTLKPTRFRTKAPGAPGRTGRTPGCCGEQRRDDALENLANQHHKQYDQERNHTKCDQNSPKHQRLPRSDSRVAMGGDFNRRRSPAHRWRCRPGTP